jgi:uncharacterized protein (DUF2384 family)
MQLLYSATSRRPRTGFPRRYLCWGERAPAELLATDDGIAIVERTLTRIEHNIPS